MLSGKQVRAVLIRFAFVEVRRHGSHMVMQRQLDATTITVPVPDHATLAAGTLASIIRLSGVPRSAFEAEP
ncbi:MAG: type II toxin-antitoxin system HicA family toxin [Fimbriimonadaceae bacterium]|nr:type II toxin-antitoxin system HicA family toxin [Fimbriimonadaceae bacterium]